MTARDLTNSGALTLTNGDGCENNATLALGGHTLVNRGTLQALRANGVGRQVQGNVTSTGALVLGAINFSITVGYAQSGSTSSWT